jgi:ketosteroid isomerase-like protein
VAGEFRSTFEQHLDPEFEYEGPPNVPEPGPYRGHQQFEAFLRYFTESFEQVALEIDDLTSLGDGVLYRQRTEIRGEGSGIDVGDRSWAVATIRDGRLLRIVEDYERDAALQRSGIESAQGPR